MSTIRVPALSFLLTITCQIQHKIIEGWGIELENIIFLFFCFSFHFLPHTLRFLVVCLFFFFFFFFHQREIMPNSILVELENFCSVSVHGDLTKMFFCTCVSFSLFKMKKKKKKKKDSDHYAVKYPHQRQ